MIIDSLTISLIYFLFGPSSRTTSIGLLELKNWFFWLFVWSVWVFWLLFDRWLLLDSFIHSLSFWICLANINCQLPVSHTRRPYTWTALKLFLSFYSRIVFYHAIFSKIKKVGEKTREDRHVDKWTTTYHQHFMLVFISINLCTCCVTTVSC